MFRAVHLLRAVCVIIIVVTINPFCTIAISVTGFKDSNEFRNAYNHYFGLLHAHYYGLNGGDDGGCNLTTDKRESTATASYAFEYAMKKGLDFFALTPHVQNNPTVIEYTSAEYDDLKKRSTEFNNLYSGKFVALPGYQWGTQTTGGHILIFDAPTRCPITNGDFTALYQWLASEDIKYAAFAHMVEDTNFNDGAYNYLGDIHINGFELANGPYNSKSEVFADTPRTYESRYIQMLNNGWHIGAIASQDNHYQNWGASTEARTVVLAESLTKEHILDALAKRRCYASLDMNARLYFDASNGAILGQVFRTQPRDITFTVRISDDDDTFKLIQLFCDGVVVDGINLNNVNEYVWHSKPQNAAENHYWFVKIVQTDGDIIWSSPIWSDRNTVDTLPPQIVDVMPSNNSTNVSTNTAIYVNFSEPMNVTITEDAFSIHPFVEGAICWQNYNSTLCWTPHKLLEKNTVYQVTIDTIASDIAGNNLQNTYEWQFTTFGEEDTTPPTIVNTYPSTGSKEVKVDVQIAITFSEPMNKEGVVRNIFTYPEMDIDLKTVCWLGTIMKFKFTSYLQPETNYTVRIGYNVMDLAGNTLDGNKNGIAEVNDDYFFTFATETKPPVPPNVIECIPKPDSKNVSNGTKIIIVFSEVMNEHTTIDGFSITPVVEGVFEFLEGGKKLVFTPIRNLTDGMVYIVCLNSSRVTDIYGNFLDGNGNGKAEGWPVDDFVWQFRVALQDVDKGEGEMNILPLIIGTIFICIAIFIVLAYRVAKRKRVEKEIAAELLRKRKEMADLQKYLKKER